MDYSLWKNDNFAFILNPCLYCLQRLVYRRERHQILFLEVFCIKKNVKEISNWKKPILWVFETGVFIVQQGLFAKYNVEDRFFTIYFHDVLHGNTGGYQGLHEVTRGYRRLQKVTGGYKGLQGVTKNYRNFFLTRTFSDSFSWLILHKNRS